MLNAILGALGTLAAAVFAVWWKNRDSNNTDIKLGGMIEKNEAHRANARAKAAADNVLAKDLLEGEDLIDALKNDDDKSNRN